MQQIEAYFYSSGEIYGLAGAGGVCLDPNRANDFGGEILVCFVRNAVERRLGVGRALHVRHQRVRQAPEILVRRCEDRSRSRNVRPEVFGQFGERVEATVVPQQGPNLLQRTAARRPGT